MPFLSEQQVECFAKVLHMRYMQVHSMCKPPPGLPNEWDDLPEHIRQANRNQADEFIKHIEYLGLTFSLENNSKNTIEQLTDEQIEIIAARIHSIWATSKIEASCDDDKIFISYNDLPEQEKDKDRVIAKNIVPMLREIGIKIKD